MQRIIDDSFLPTDQRHIAAKTHRHLTATGTPGASGKYDPKTIITVEGIKYQPLPNEDSVCELCESGDMIPPWKRHYDSKYRPSIWRFLWVRFRAMIKNMKPRTREMVEGPEAFTLFRDAMKKILSVPKSAIPPSPYKPHRPKKKKPSAPKG